MSVGDALSKGLSVTGTGLVIVFSVLIILMVVMMLMKVIFYKPQQQKAEAVEVKDTDKQEATQKTGNEDELIAVITAAVAASMNTSVYNLKIKSFKRISNSQSAWNKAGVTDIIDSRF